MTGDYLTLKQQAQDEFTEKKSRFIGYASPVATGEEAMLFIKKIRSRHREARHNVYAYIVNKNGVINQRYSDDGEPQGTGGMPVLDVIQKQGLMNCCIVVTRYFGGVLLGASGLVRAYSRGAAAAIEAAGILKVVKCALIKITIPYNLYDKINNYMETEKLTQVNSDFKEIIELTYEIPDGRLAAVLEDIKNITNGKAVVYKE